MNISYYPHCRHHHHHFFLLLLSLAVTSTTAAIAMSDNAAFLGGGFGREVKRKAFCTLPHDLIFMALYVILPLLLYCSSKDIVWWDVSEW
jgi:hypothetical protein